MKSLNFAIIIFVLLTSGAHSQQYYRVNDSDGYVNLRNNPDKASKVIYRIDDKQCVIGLYAEGKWIKCIYFELSYRALYSGFIHESRLVKDESCKAAQNIKENPQGEIALESLNQGKNFMHASIWFRENQKIIADDGYFSEAYSEYVMKTLATSFSENILILNKLRTENPQFIEFILKHIDPTGSYTDLEKIVKNEGHCASLNPSEICDRVIKNAKMAIQEF